MNNDDFSSRDEADISKILQVAGQREIMPDDLKKNWSNHFRKELDEANKGKNNYFRPYWLAACASLLMVGLLILTRFPQPAVNTDIAVEIFSGDTRVTLAAGSETTLKQGQALSIGSVIETKSQSFLSINYHSFDVRLNADTRLGIDRDELRLLSGEIFVSSSSQQFKQGITIVTPFATITDIGTQFIVTLSKDKVVSTVREGSINVETQDTSTSAAASVDGAQQVTVDHQNHIVISETEGSGEQWEWIYQLTPVFKLEGKSVYEYLLWSTRETGLALQFVDQRAELYARTTLLRGDIPELNPRLSVPLVLATTDLTATTTEQGLLHVQLTQH